MDAPAQASVHCPPQYNVLPVVLQLGSLDGGLGTVLYYPPEQNSCNGVKRLRDSCSQAESPKSGYYGVTWYKASRRWQARLCTGQKQIHLGYYKVEEDAARAYDAAVLQYTDLGRIKGAPLVPKGASARSALRSTHLNFPEEATAVLQALAAQPRGPVTVQDLISSTNASMDWGQMYLQPLPCQPGGIQTPEARDSGAPEADDSRVPEAEDSRARPLTSVFQGLQYGYGSMASSVAAAGGVSRGLSSGDSEQFALLSRASSQASPGGTLLHALSASPDAAAQPMACIDAPAVAPCVPAPACTTLASTGWTGAPQAPGTPAAGVPGRATASPHTLVPATMALDELLSQAGQAAVPGMLLPQAGVFIPTGTMGTLQVYEHVWDGTKLVLQKVVVGVLTPSPLSPVGMVG